MKDGGARKNAVILSGGGANGAYEVGVLKALFRGESASTDHRPIEPEIFAGTSIGAFNAALIVSLLASEGSEAVDQLERIWLEVIPHDKETGQNHFFRYRADPLEFFDPEVMFRNPVRPYIQLAEDSGYFAKDLYRRGLNFFLSPGRLEQRTLRLLNLSTILSNEPGYRLIKKTIRFENIRQTNKVLKIAATNWRTGDLKVFGNADLTDDIAPSAVLASTALPGIFAQVEVAGEYYADGGVVMNTPLKLGLDAGAEVLHIVYLNPDVRAIPLLPVADTIDTLGRTFAIQFASTVDRDIEVAEGINKGIEILEKAAKGAPLSATDTRPLIMAASKLARLKGTGEYRKITIHRYQPVDVLGGVLGILNFDARRISDLIKQGFDDAVNHDCAANKCILS
ncbi:MAG TPA: patatin-like phospholipase family protein [Pyrinomonadaceae bacterium]|nr:patatin-like phospholipase family protein [Pyrinomonadaceae bacterium]